MSRGRRSREVNADINITAFMNLMVVLVPFLLITAVFSQISVLELNLPAAQDQSQTPPDENKKPLVLEVLIYKNRFEIVDRQTGPLKIVPQKSGDYDYNNLKSFMEIIKGKFPDITEVTLLLDKNIPYDVLIQTMDTVRVFTRFQGSEPIQYELFPDISIGDAPPDTSPARGRTSSTLKVQRDDGGDA